MRLIVGGNVDLPDSHSAALQAPRLYAAALAAASTRLAALLHRAAIPIDRSVWTALGIERWNIDGSSWDTATLHRIASARAKRSDSSSDSPDIPNLWHVWVELPPPDVARSTALSSQDSAIAIRRRYRLPLSGPDTGIGPPRSCARCGAASLPIGVVHPPTVGPRGRVDSLGEHALVCAQSAGWTQRRHNTLAAAIAAVAREAGFSANTDAGPIFDTSKSRPADIWITSHPKYPGGLAVDCTIVTRAGARGDDAVDIAESRKRKKYDDMVNAHPGMGFAPFAVDTDGSLRPAAWDLIHSFARSHAALGASRRNFREALEWTLAVLAHAFVDGCVQQIRGFEFLQNTHYRSAAKGARAVSATSPRTTALRHSPTPTNGPRTQTRARRGRRRHKQT